MNERMTERRGVFLDRSTERNEEVASRVDQAMA